MKQKNKVFIALIAIAALWIGACSSSGGGGGSSTTPTANTLTLSGTLSSSNPLSLEGTESIDPSSIGFSVTLSDLELYATCFSNPPAIAQGNVGSDGTFSVSMTCPKGSFVSGLFRDKTNFESVGMIVFEDSSKKDMSGENKKTTSVALSGDVNFGAISIGSDGKVTIPVSTISSSVSDGSNVATTTAFDFHGVWTAAPYTGTLGKGYVTACAAGAQDCNGPWTGMPISLIRLVGSEFTSTQNCSVVSGNLSGSCATTDGTVDSTKPVYGISIWGGGVGTWGSDSPMNGETMPLTACSYKLGFTADEARAYGKISIATVPTLAGQQLLLQAYSFSTPSGFGGDTCTTASSGTNGTYGCNQPWMKTNATAKWSMQECTNVSKTGSDSATYKFFVCKATATVGGTPSTTVYFASTEGGGCVDSNNKPLRVENWSNITSSSCNSSSHPVTGVTTGTCTYTNQVPIAGGAATNFSCAWTQGAFTATNMNTPIDNSTINYSTVSHSALITSGQYCKDIVVTSGNTATELMRLRCYASANEGGSKMSGCSKEYRFDWSTNDVTQFVRGGREKPEGSFVTNVGQYSADGTSFMVNDLQTDTGSIFVNNQNVLCNIERSTSIVATKVSDTQLKTEVIESGRITDMTKPACRAVSDCVGKLIKAAEDAGTVVNSQTVGSTCSSNGDVAWRLIPSKMIFLLNKSSN